MTKPRLRQIREFFSGTRVIVFGFFAAVVIGTLLLKCPISQREPVSWTDSLFVAASSVCVTGLTTVNIGQVFSTFGHIVILLLIQVGGLGFITFSTLLLMMLGKRISLSNKQIIQSAYNVNSPKDLTRMTKNIILAAFCIEGAGAVGYAFSFIPLYGVKGIWYSVFHSVSAFCNAGIDIFGGDSFTEFRDNIPVNLVTILLIIVSGIGFPVYWEFCRLVRDRKDRNHSGSKPSVQMKTVLSVTALLIITGTVLTLITERNNEATIGTLTTGRKILSSLFQSVTLRTAGFATIPQSAFTNASCCVYLLFMFTGGSPAGTAGGVKTVTVAVLFASLIANIRGRKDVNMFGRKIPDNIVRQCISIITFSFSVLFIGTVLLLSVQECDFLDAVYEMTSAIATVGLSRGITADLNTAAKLIVTATMYLGRIGPISLALFFNGKTIRKLPEKAETSLIIG